jgi:hypothetical protein
MAQEFYCIQPKFTLGELGVQVVVSQSLKDNMKVFDMIFWSFRVDQDVVNEDHNKFVEFLHENRIHEVHEVGWSISETKRHD